MSEIILSLIPITILSLTGVILFGFVRKINKAHIFGLICIITALVVNSIYIFYPTILNLDQSMQFLLITQKSLWFQEIILVLFMIYYVSIYARIQKSHNADMILGILFLIISNLLLIFFTENLIILSVLMVSVLYLTDFLHYFGIRRKKANSLRLEQYRKLIAVILLIGVNYLLYTWLGSNNISYLILQIEVLSPTQSLVIFSGFLLVLMLLFNIGILGVRNFNDYFGQSNLFHLRLLNTIVYPFLMIIFLNIFIRIFSSNDLFGVICLIFGMIGLAFSLGHLITELSGKHIKKSQNLMKILGFYHNCALNLVLLLISFYHLNSSSTDAPMFELITNYIYIITVGTSLIWEAFNPVLLSIHNSDLKEISGYNKIFPSFTILVLMAMFYMIGPGFIGFDFTWKFLEITSMSASISPLNVMFIWGILITYFIFLFALPFMMGTIMVNLYFKTKSLNPADSNKPSSQFPLRYFIIGPTLLIVGIILQILFSTSISELQNFFI